MNIRKLQFQGRESFNFGFPVYIADNRESPRQSIHTGLGVLALNQNSSHSLVIFSDQDTFGVDLQSFSRLLLHSLSNFALAS
jgi:hypothetical protein